MIEKAIDTYDEFISKKNAEINSIIEEIFRRFLATLEVVKEERFFGKIEFDLARPIFFFEGGSGMISVKTGDATAVNDIPFNTALFNEIDDFMDKYYPGLKCGRCCKVNFVEMKLSVDFAFARKFELSDFRLTSNHSYFFKDKNLEKIYDTLYDSVERFLEDFKISRTTNDQIKIYSLPNGIISDGHILTSFKVSM